jgi:hypothetical protein
MWNLRELVDQYLTLAGEFGRPVALEQFPLGREEIVALFGGFDEDYHISRYLHFSRLPGGAFKIGGEDVTHLSIDQGIQEIL